MHQLVFTAEASIPNTNYKAQGQGTTKQMAQVNAAAELLKQLPEAKNEQN